MHPIHPLYLFHPIYLFLPLYPIFLYFCNLNKTIIV